jgi:hypothetical protein
MRRWLLVSAVGVVGGCTLFHRPADPGPDLGVYDPNAAAYAGCPEAITTVAYDETLLTNAAAAIAGGADDAPLSPPMPSFVGDVSCLHLRVDRDPSGKITDRRVVSLATAGGLNLKELVLYRWQTTPTGYTEEIDENGDGAIESSADTTTDASGTWQGTVTTRYADAQKAPYRRLSSTPVGANTVHLREELWNGSAWDLISENDVSRAQTKCVTPSDLPPPTGPSGACTILPACSAMQRDQILNAAKRALRMVENCAPARITSKPAAELAAGLIEPTCMTGPGCAYGETDPTFVPDADHKRELLINIDHLGDNQFMPTVWHELVHIGLGDEGRHNATPQQLAALLGKGLLVDRTYACELMCFPSGSAPPTQCDCATCMDQVIKPDGTTERATTCSSICSNFAPCTAQSPATETGSYCPRMQTFCDTVGECRAACAVDADSCGKLDPKTGNYRREGGNLSRSCNPACN